jgi:Na+/melibiose symporter-like transporter
MKERMLTSSVAQCTFQSLSKLMKKRATEKTIERAPSVGYVELLRSNRGFRMLWLGQVVSQMGDWFDTIAVYTLALQLTGSSRSVALIMVARFLPSVVMGPLSGVVADRFSRRSIMILSGHHARARGTRVFARPTP